MSSMIFAYFWHVMKVKRGLFGLATLLCAQSATVWKWYAYTQENNPSINISPASTIWSAQKGVVRALADTIYVMGTYQGQDGTNINLPDTSGSGANPAIPGEGNYVRTYLGAYDRQTGAIMWWMWFYHVSGSTWGQDLVVASGGVVYLLLIGHPQSVSWEYRDRAGNSRSGSVMPSFNGDRSSYILRIVPYDPSPTFLSYSAIGLTNSGACDLKHLLLVGNELYAAGEWKTNTILASLKEEGTTSANIFYTLNPLNDKTRALIVRWRVTPTFQYLNAGQLRYEGTLTYRDVTGHRIAYDAAQNKLRWLFEAQDNASSSMSLIYELSNPAGTYSSPGITGSSYTLRVLSLNTDLSPPLVPNYHNLAYTNSIPAYDTPPYLYAHNDTITWCRAASYSMNVIDGASTTTLNPASGPDYIAVIQQVLISASNNAQLSRHTQISGATGLHLSAIATERRGDLIYLTGASNGQQWAAGPLGNRVVSRSGFLLGLRASGTGYSMIGYRRFYGIGGSQDSVEAIGMAYDTLRAQFYILGTAEDSLLLEPVWPMGQKDTIRPSALSNIPERLWLGRLDWYRITTSPQTLTRCVPDTVHPNISFAEYGTFASSIPEAPKETTYVWLSLSNPYYAYQRPAYLRATYHSGYPPEVEGARVYSLPVWVEGRLDPGAYILTRPIWGRNHFENDTWADVIDTIRLEVSGTTIPILARNTASAYTYMVVPYAGQTGMFTPDISGPYPRHRRENWKFPLVSDMFYHPYYYAPPRHPGREMLIVTSNNPTPQVWGIDPATGEVWDLPASTTGGPSPRYFPDPVRGTYWAIEERPPASPYTMRLRRAPFNPDTSDLIKQGISAVRIRRDAYPLRYDSVWIRRIHRSVVLPDGDFVISAWDYPSSFTSSLWRISLGRDSVYRVTGRTTTSDCPQDGIGSASRVGRPTTEIAVWGDTLFWIEDFPNTCSPPYSGGSRALLRRAYPSGSIMTYEVETLDTIYYPSGNGIAGYLLFSPLPTPGLIFGMRNSSRVIRYDLFTGRRDTLVQCSVRSPCCAYGLSDWISGIGSPVALLGSGALAIREGGSIKLAVPIALAGAEDTLVTEGPVGAVSSAGGTGVAPSFTGREIRFGWPAASGPGLDSTYLAVSLSGCTSGKPRYYPFYHLPRFRVWMRGPDTVCVGQVFHTYVGRDTEVVESRCRVSHRLFMPPASAQDHLVGIASGDASHRWRATQPGYDTIKTAIQRPKWRYLVSDSALSLPVRVRQGHRLRLSVALEGPYETTTFLHRRHPFFTRYNLGAYNQRILGVSSDSLWRLPYPPGDSLMINWNRNISLSEPTGPCPGTDSWYCDTIWTTLARVELRESPTGPVVDSAYALVDSAGRLTSYAAPLGDGTLPLPAGHADTLHFCHCDPTTPKYITVRFPHHLPLHTPAISLPVRGVGQADSLDLRDPTYLEGIPGEHYTFVPGPGGTVRAAAWAGNCADLHNAFIPGGAHVDAGWINAADYDFIILRNGVTSGFSIADLNSDGVVDALDAVIVISNQNALRQSSRP